MRKNEKEDALKRPLSIGYLNGEPAEPAPDSIGRRAVFVGIDRTPFETKPHGWDVGGISDRITSPYNENLTADQLARAISLGQSFIPSAHEGKRSPDTWKAQQLFCVDVDNDAETVRACGRTLDLDAGLSRAFDFGLPLLISYLSFSATEDTDRYRLIFSLEGPTYDRDAARTFGDALLAAYPEADRCSTQLNRFFYGTRREVMLWEIPERNRLSAKGVGHGVH